jgi:hypothetical protein
METELDTKNGNYQQTVFHTPYKVKGKTKIRSLTVHERRQQ